jgi:hypothetical protein
MAKSTKPSLAGQPARGTLLDRLLTFLSGEVVTFSLLAPEGFRKGHGRFSHWIGVLLANCEWRANRRIQRFH